MASESDDDDFATYGTPLEPIEEDAVPKKRAVTIEDQVATDKHGRRRFHGAFTGGFSAGFFNSVGSLEGWKPSQFKSSRSSKFQAQLQKPEDFMDDEDMDEFGIAPKTLRPTSEYKQADQGSSRKRQLKHFTDGPIPGVPVLKTLEPVKETIGIRLMMKMGWKPGQGVGPRLSKTEKTVSKKHLRQKKMYGCALPSQESEQVSSNESSSEEEPMDLDVTFAPDDFEPYLVKPKNDVFGLGYSGLDRRPVLSSHVDLFGPPSSSLVMQEKKKRVNIRGQAFGVGAFEREDEDIYAKEDMSQYDFALDTPQMLAEKRKQERNSRKALPAASSDVLEGFVTSSKAVIQKRYPPPPLPQGFTPVHHVKESRFSVSAATTTDANAGKPRLTAAERSVLVNESTGSSRSKVVESKEPEPVNVERTSSGSFKPFLLDPDKQQRYEKYLTLVTLGQTDKLKSLQPLNMTEWEQQREVGEFAQAARLYRPLSAAFSERFVSASQPDDATDPLAPVARTPSAEDSYVNAAKHKMYGKLTRRVGEWSPHSVLCKRFNIPQPGSSSNASQSRPTRPKFSVFNFLDAAPFNAPTQAEESADPVEVPSQAKDELTESSSVPNISTLPLSKQSEDEVEEKKKEGTSVKDDEIEQLVESTNKMDLYKAIFLSSSDESDGEEEKLTNSSTTEQKKPEEINILRNTSPPRGIFANLDLDKLKKPALAKETESSKPLSKSPPRGIFANLDLEKLSKPSKPSIDDKNERINQVEEKGNEPNAEESNMYGPSLPQNPKLQKRLENVTVVNSESSDSEGEWVEQEDSSDGDSKKHKQSKKKHSKKSHRKSKKHKEKKHKHKKKKK